MNHLGEMAVVAQDLGMDYSDQRNVRLDERETDHVSRWLLRVAISMIVLGTVFALLDWYDLLPSVPQPK
jgi:hypothetical protein